MHPLFRDVAVSLWSVLQSKTTVLSSMHYTESANVLSCKLEINT